MKTEEARSKTDSELAFDLKGLKKELFELKFKAATDSGGSTAKIRENRRSIARINTILHERKSGVRGQEPR